MSTDNDPLPAVHTRLGYLLKHVALRLDELHSRTLAPFGVDARELGVLLVLAAHEPGSQHQAAQRLGVDRTTMVAVLDVLESKGMVSRTPDPADRRRNVIGLTEQGTQTLHDAVRASDEAERMLLAPLASRRQQPFREALDVLATHPATTPED